MKLLQFTFSLILYTRFGVCEPYSGDIKLCNNIFTAGVDYVFIAAIWDSQDMLSTILEHHIPTNFDVLSRIDGDFCYDQLLKLICNYYLSPCGTESYQTSPRSVCPDDCSAVQRDCPTAWRAAQQGLYRYQFIDCSNITAFLFPLPRCCTGVGPRNKEGDIL